MELEKYIDAFDVLSNERRVLAIKLINEHGPMRLKDLSDKIYEREDRDCERRAVYVAMTQSHMDVFEERGVLDEEYRPARKVSPGEMFTFHKRLLIAARIVDYIT